MKAIEDYIMYLDFIAMAGLNEVRMEELALCYVAQNFTDREIEKMRLKYKTEKHYQWVNQWVN